jgi:hypothetical protein
VGIAALGFAFVDDVVDCVLPIANAMRNTITVAVAINTMRRSRRAQDRVPPGSSLG